MSRGLQTDNESGEERNNRPDWSPPSAFDHNSDLEQANNSPHKMEDHGKPINKDRPSSEGEVSPYLLRPRPAVQVAKGKERSEEDVEIQTMQQRKSSDEKCFNCAKGAYKCSGAYPFTEKCDTCMRRQAKCYPQDKGQCLTRGQPAEEKCYSCRKRKLRFDGT